MPDEEEKIVASKFVFVICWSLCVGLYVVCVGVCCVVCVYVDALCHDYSLYSYATSRAITKFVTYTGTRARFHPLPSHSYLI